MKELEMTTQFKKDLKKYANQKKKISALQSILSCLAEERPLPENCRPHLLSNNYKGCMECHVGGDFLLVWIDDSLNVVKLVRLGSHAELFG